MKKANQKRMLGDMAIEGGNFTTAFFKQVFILTKSHFFYSNTGFSSIIYHIYLFLKVFSSLNLCLLEFLLPLHINSL